MKYFLLPVLLLVNCLSFSQVIKNNATDSIVGIWKGSSLCQVKNSPCHDESVVYHISKSPIANTYSVQANKMVNGQEEEMGLLDFIYTPSRHLLTCRMKDKQDREGVWEFTITNKKMSGTLTINGNTLFRKIEIRKE